MSKLPGKKTIDDLGGYQAVAKACGWPPTTVHSWWREDKAIPEWRHDKLLKLARRKGIELPQPAA